MLVSLAVVTVHLPHALYTRIKEWESSQISNYTEADAVSAMRKLQDAAFRWDHTNYIESAYVNGFEAYLTPYDFKQQIERSFQLRLSGAEVSTALPLPLPLPLLQYPRLCKAVCSFRSLSLRRCVGAVIALVMPPLHSYTAIRALHTVHDVIPSSNADRRAAGEVLDPAGRAQRGRLPVPEALLRAAGADEAGVHQGAGAPGPQEGGGHEDGPAHGYTAQAAGAIAVTASVVRQVYVFNQCLLASKLFFP